MKKKTSRRRIDVNVEELDRVIDETEKGPLSESGPAEAEDARCMRWWNHWSEGVITEKTNAVLGDQNTPAPSEEAQPERAKASPPGTAAMARTRFVAPKR